MIKPDDLDESVEKSLSSGSQELASAEMSDRPSETDAKVIDVEIAEEYGWTPQQASEARLYL